MKYFFFFINQNVHITTNILNCFTSLRTAGGSLVVKGNLFCEAASKSVTHYQQTVLNYQKARCTCAKKRDLRTNYVFCFLRLSRANNKKTSRILMEIL